MLANTRKGDEMFDSTFCLETEGSQLLKLSEDLYRKVCRTGFDQPGFCSIILHQMIDSVAFRQLMVDLKESLSEIHLRKWGKGLGYLSAARFDQQVTTKLHLDGGPPECFLMLGYEPSSVSSKIDIADYSRCAFDLGLTPEVFMQRHNPMFQSGYDLLRPYLTTIPCFSCAVYQIVCINNSIAPHSATEPKWQGTLHTAEILTPDDSARRIINSTMIAPVEREIPPVVSDQQIQDFIWTTAVHRRGHDKGYLVDDG